MPWVKIDDAMPRHPKIAPLSAPAFQLYVFGLCCSAQQQSDGFLPTAVAKLLIPRAAKYIPELVENGLWDPADDGYEIHDYGLYNPTGDKTAEIRAKRAEAGKVGGQRSKPGSKSKANLKQNAFGTESKPPKQNRNPLPLPQPPDTTSVVSVAAAPPNEQWDGLRDVFDYKPVGGEVKLWGRVTKELREMGATRSSIRIAAQRYRVDMSQAVLTVPALGKHYQRLMSPTWQAPRKNGGLSAAEMLTYGGFDAPARSSDVVGIGEGGISELDGAA